MLAKPRNRWLCFAAFLFVVGIAFLLIPPYADYCGSDHGDEKYCAGYEVASFLAVFIDAHNGVVTAIATMFIGLFTYTLKKSTDRMWVATKQAAEVAQKSADALPAIERAYLFLDDEIEANFVNVTREKNGDRMEAVVKFSFRNHGKTPAILKGIKGTAGHSSSYPEVGRKSLALIEGEFPDGVVVTSGRKSRPFECECFMDKANFEEARGGFGYIVFFGEVRFSDVLEDTWRVGFCREYDFGSGQFVYLPTYKNLNYYEKEERKGG
jgi:hypothetical protein